VVSADRTTFTGSHMSRTQTWPADPIAVSAAAGPASETDRAGSPEAVPTPARSPQKPGVSSLDSDAWMRSLFESERWVGSYRSCPHERLGPRGLGQKTTDFSAIPLCTAHHRENLDSYHRLGEKMFLHKRLT
jgi:hypothetical protein